jgi:HEAT repeat protein
VAHSCLPLAFVLAVCPAAVRAQDDDPKLRGQPLSEWLRMLREEPSVDRRRAALLAAELIGPGKSTRVVPGIMAALRDDADERIREAAAAALGRIGERQAARSVGEDARFTAGRDALLAAFRTDKSARVRAAAATGLGRLDASDAAGAVTDLAVAVGSGNTPPEVRAAAAETLRRLGESAADAVPALQQALTDPGADEATRTRAALALGNVGEAATAALPALVAVAGDAKTATGLLKAVVDTLGRLGPPAAAASDRLGEIITSKASDVELRRAAARALDRIGPGALPGLPSLRQALQDDDRFVRSLALHAIGQQRPAAGPEARATVAAVLTCLGDRVVEVRVAAAETVASLGAETLGPDLSAARERMREATHDGQKAVREAAEQALRKIEPTP